MPLRVLLVSDDNWVGHRACGKSEWRQVSWGGLTPQLLESSRPAVLVLCGPAERFGSSLVRNWRTSGERRLMAVLPQESGREEIERALSMADEVVLASERPDLFELRIRRLLHSCGSEAASAYEGLLAEMGRANLVGQAPSFLRAAERVTASARTDLPVLITGETGTGKELFARAVHFMSPRRNHPFIPVDCGGIPDHLFENELFGHVRGAFTDAHTEQRGLASAAEGGTLFLDEVESLPLTAQAKLLRFLQERQFKALGSEKWSTADVRVVAATNEDLGQLTAAKQFRQDLLFRLDVLRLNLPPLRERPEDIPLLAQHFLLQYGHIGAARSFSADALRKLASYHWPGNVRELLNVVQRAAVFSRSAQIDACELPLAHEPAPDGRPGFRCAREEAIEKFERAFVEDLLVRHQGNVTRAAREAGKERRAFGRLVKKYGLRSRGDKVGQN